VIALTLYAAVVLRVKGSGEASCRGRALAAFTERPVAVHAAVWGLAGVATALPAATHSYGPAGGWLAPLQRRAHKSSRHSCLWGLALVGMAVLKQLFAQK
jgi:hypothetical protein